MKKKSVLSNPFVVSGLGVLAAIFVYVQLLSPLLQSPNATQSKETRVAHAGVAESAIVDEDSAIAPINSDSGTSLVEFRHQPLEKNGWRRQGKRDPFILEQRSGKLAWWLTDSVRPEQKRVNRNSKSSVRNKKAAKQAMLNSQLRAWTSGPSGSAAYVNGHIIRTGDAFGSTRVERIDNDTVILRGLHGSQTLILAPGGSL